MTTQLKLKRHSDGVSNSDYIPTQNYYVDQTRYIEMLEEKAAIYYLTAMPFWQIVAYFRYWSMADKGVTM